MSERRFDVLVPSTMTSAQQRVVDDMLAGPRATDAGIHGTAGELRGPFNALLRSPGLFERAQRLGEHVRFHTSLPPALNELAILITARRWTAQYEWVAHSKLALAAGLNAEIVAEIAQGERPGRLSQPQAAVYDFVSELLQDGGVSDSTFNAALALFGEEGVVDLIGAAGYYTLVSFVLNVERHPLVDGEIPLRTL